MPLGFDVVPGPTKQPVRTDDKGGTGAAHVLLAVIHFHAPCAVGVVEFKVFVHQQREVEFLLLYELLMGRFAVFGDAEDDDVLAVQASHVVAKITGLGGATWGGIFGVEVKYDIFSSWIWNCDI